MTLAEWMGCGIIDGSEALTNKFHSLDPHIAITDAGVEAIACGFYLAVLYSDVLPGWIPLPIRLGALDGYAFA